MMKKILFILLGILALNVVNAQIVSGGLKLTASVKPARMSEPLKEYLDKGWKDFTPEVKDPAGSVVANRERLAAYIAEHDTQTVEFACLYNAIKAVQAMLEYCKTQDFYTIRSMSGIAPVLIGVDLKSKEIQHYSPLRGAMSDYFELRYVMEDMPALDIPGSTKVSEHLSALRGKSDYKSFREVLELGNEPLTLEYMKRIKEFFPFDGYTKGLRELRFYIDKLMPESSQKKEITDLCDLYDNFRDGLPAADFDMLGYDGKYYTLKDFRGKVLVVDIWASWCGGCIARIPSFIEVAETYKNRDDIEFITVSIDQPDAVKAWKKVVDRLNLTGYKNLILDEGKASFNEKYNIVGIPRYFIIDRNGNNVTLYAPSPNKAAFREMIDKILSR